MAKTFSNRDLVPVDMLEHIQRPNTLGRPSPRPKYYTRQLVADRHQPTRVYTMKDDEYQDAFLRGWQAGVKEFSMLGPSGDQVVGYIQTPLSEAIERGPAGDYNLLPQKPGGPDLEAREWATALTSEGHDHTKWWLRIHASDDVKIRIQRELEKHDMTEEEEALIAERQALADEKERLLKAANKLIKERYHSE